MYYIYIHNDFAVLKGLLFGSDSRFPTVLDLALRQLQCYNPLYSKYRPIAVGEHCLVLSACVCDLVRESRLSKVLDLDHVVREETHPNALRSLTAGTICSNS